MSTTALQAVASEPVFDDLPSEDPVSNDLQDLGRLAGVVTDDVPRDNVAQKKLFENIRRRLMKARKLKKNDVSRLVSIYSRVNGPCMCRRILTGKVELRNVEVFGNQVRIVSNH